MSKKCILCRSSAVNELQLGPMHSRGNINVHEYCLYLSSALVQRDNGGNGILDFALKDIRNESQRTTRLVCCYCSMPGANIGCCNIACRSNFHTYCGIQYGSQNQYVGTFKSFCKKHIKPYKSRPADNEECAICFDRLIPRGQSFSYTKYMHGTCCGHGWYHKDCLQSYANSSGYFFKCPLCNDTSKFVEVKKWGIFVPDRDAAWEEGDAYADQLQVSLECTADNCLSPEGRVANSLLELHFCNLCGSSPVHAQCTKYNAVDYCCSSCSTTQANPDLNNSSDDECDPLDNIDMLLARSAMQSMNSTAMQAFAFAGKENHGSVGSPKQAIAASRRPLQPPQTIFNNAGANREQEQPEQMEVEINNGREEELNLDEEEEKKINKKTETKEQKLQPRVILSRRHTGVTNPLRPHTQSNALSPQQQRHPRSRSLAARAKMYSPFDISCVANRTRARSRHNR